MSEPMLTFYMLDGATELSGLRAAIWVTLHWPRLRRELTGTPGYIAHRLWFGWPWTIGLVTWWADEAAVYKFAHRPEHRRFWAFGADPAHTRGGWLAHYRFTRGGPLWGNGVRTMTTRLEGWVPPASNHAARPAPTGRSHG
jgi:heme-degrading monooxygenase HmoA